MRYRESAPRAGSAFIALLAALGIASPAFAGSIQQPGLTTGLAEGYGLTEGLYSVSVLNFGPRTTSPDYTTQTVGIPLFLTWSTPWDIGNAHVSFKAAPLVEVKADGPGLSKGGYYSPYAGAWFSWWLGDGYNLSVGEGAQIGVSDDLTKALGRDYTAFQQNVALSYVKTNWNITGNLFYTQGRTRDTGSQPRTLNLDFTAIKRSGREEFGVVAFAQTDLNSPSVGYLGEGRKQSEIAVGGLYSYLIGNLMSVQFKLTTDIHQKNLGGRDTRLWIQLVTPLWTPPAPTPRNAAQ
jgi:hypothetical protein